MAWESPGRFLKAVHAVTRSRLAVWATTAGALLGAADVSLSAVNAVSAQQSMAMALPAGVATIGGMVGFMVPDAWAAWRRGFLHGCEAGQLVHEHAADIGTKAIREVLLGHRAEDLPLAG
jgi:hypothetical protein